MPSRAIGSKQPSRRSDTLLFIAVFVVVFSLTPLVILSGASIGFGTLMGIVAALTVAVLVVRWPISGFFVVAGCVTLIEQAPLPIPILTDHLYVFYWPPRLEGLIERPIGFLFIFICFVFLCQYLAKRERPLRGGELLGPFVLYLLCVAGGVLHGLASHGDFKIIVVEIRPFWYLFMSYLLAYNLVTQKEHIRAFFWIVIVCAAIKGLQGSYIYLVVLHGSLEGHHEIMAHEESFFFIALLLLVALFCLHHRYRPQFYAALLALPGVVIAMIGNQRRADYIALLVGLVVVWLLVFWVKPYARARLVVLMLICALVGTGYVVAFAHSTGGLAQPAHAIVSFFQPDPADASSNLYRMIENYDLKYTAKQNPLGMGFGLRFLQPITLPDISDNDPYYVYVPHNTIYWVLMRLGPIGYAAFWYLIGAIIVRGCLVVRRLKDSYLQLVAIYVVGVTFMEILVAFADYQLYFYRNVIYLGLLVGILMRLPALDEKQRVDA